MDITYTPSPHFNDRQSPIDALVVHYTDMESTQKALDWLIDPRSQVSAHYLISETGRIHALVEDSKRAWHAGESFWKGRTDINSCSLGIELSNPGHSHGYTPFPDAQINALIQLCLHLQARWNIPSSRILGHSDVAPHRKQDPGHLFPWNKLHHHGLGLWPSLPPASRAQDLFKTLSTIGYDISSPEHAILAFQRHFQPHKLDGIPDTETLALAHGLLASAP